MPDAVASFYGPLAAATFMLNMQLGSGVLLLPAAFADAGLILSSLFLLIVCATAYISGTWIIEAMAIANHKLKIETASHKLDNPLLDGESSEDDAPQERYEFDGDDSYSLSHRVEMGALAQTFFPLWGQVRVRVRSACAALRCAANYACTELRWR